MTNAVKYGGNRVEVSAEPADDMIVIRVVDDGMGIPDERVAHIFEPYESAHDEPSQPGSLGLGLSISRTLARLMGGDLTYHRIADHTEFRLMLPALQALFSLKNSCAERPLCARGPELPRPRVVFDVRPRVLVPVGHWRSPLATTAARPEPAIRFPTALAAPGRPA